jgi:hypothetical protein
MLFYFICVCFVLFLFLFLVLVLFFVFVFVSCFVSFVFFVFVFVFVLFVLFICCYLSFIIYHLCYNANHPSDYQPDMPLQHSENAKDVELNVQLCITLCDLCTSNGQRDKYVLFVNRFSFPTRSLSYSLSFLLALFLFALFPTRSLYYSLSLLLALFPTRSLYYSLSFLLALFTTRSLSYSLSLLLTPFPTHSLSYSLSFFPTRSLSFLLTLFCMCSFKNTAKAKSIIIAVLFFFLATRKYRKKSHEKRYSAMKILQEIAMLMIKRASFSSR